MTNGSNSINATSSGASNSTETSIWRLTVTLHASSSWLTADRRGKYSVSIDIKTIDA